MFKAIFFDLDDTIVNSLGPHIKAQRKIFELYGIDYDEIERRTRHHDFFGMRVIDILEIERDLMDISEEKLSLSELAAKRQEIFLELVKKEAKLFEGAEEAIKFAKKQGKIVAIVSSGTKKYIQLVMDIFKLEKYIDFFICEEDVRKGKPSPDCYLKAFEKLPKEKKIRKDECLVVEDSVKGVQAANAAGIPVCYVPFTQTKEDITFDFKIKTLKELPHIIK